MTTVPALTMNDGLTIPQLGFGVFRVDPEQTESVVADALEVGYRHIDTAALYYNEGGVGAALKASGIPRDELFITTKLGNDRHEDVAAALQESLDALGLDYVDLYLIHWPVPKQDKYLTAWESLIAAREEGLIRSAGVSNFLPEHLDRLAEFTDLVPAVNQIELHVEFQQRELRAYHAAHGILTEAWGPLGHGLGLSSDPRIAAIAQAHGVTVAQAIVRWHLQLGNIVIPKSNHRGRMAENFDVFGFELSAAELASIAEIDKGAAGRTGRDPREV